MPSSGMNFKFKDAQTNANCERVTSNISAEKLSDNVSISSARIILQSDNQGAENNSSTLQVPVKDDERDLIELMIASSTIPSAPSISSNSAKPKSDKTSGSTGGSTKSDAKKRVKQQRELSRDLALLSQDNRKVQDEKAFSFAQAYFLKVRDRLDEQSFIEFVKILNSFDIQSMTVCDLYRKIILILEPYCELSEEFLAFLLPEQAMELGVYMEYLCVTKMRHFLHKLEVYFNKQPQQIRKIYECLARLSDQSASSKTDIATVRRVMLPLLKGSSLLTEYFLQLFPYEQPPVFECSDDKDFEKVDCGEFDESSAGVHHDEDVHADIWDWETVEIPDLEDPFGGDSCPCTCHSNSVSSVSVHCFSCGIKFINGRVFIQNGKVLRPAKLVIEGVNKKEIMERIGKKTTLKNEDDKGSASLKHRKRPASDSSPVKNNIGTSACTNSSLLSPTGTESEEDVSDCKPPSVKVKSPRNIKSASILKTLQNKTVINKDSEKDCALRTEEEILNTHSFVLLDDLSIVNKSKKNDAKDILHKDVSRKSCESEEINTVEFKDNEGDIPSSSSPPRSSSCNDLVVIRDDEDDDIEYIEIDDDYADDDVDLVEDDDDDDDIEEYEEEIAHNEDDEEDYEDIEVVEIDEDDERDMDVDYLAENNEDETHHLDGGKIDDEHCVGDSICIKTEIECEGDKITENDQNEDIVSDKSDAIQEVLIHDIKVEIVNDELNVENDCDKPKLVSSLVDEDKLPVSESTIKSNKMLPMTDCAELMAADNNESMVEVSSPISIHPPAEDSSMPLHPTSPSPTNTTVSSSSSSSSSSFTSWTKEEDKVILQTFQQEGDTDENFIMITKQLPQRSVEEIKSRFNILLQLLKRMTTNKNNND